MPHQNSLHIENWFTSIAPIQKSPPEHVVNELLSRFGIKSAMDVMKFLQSPEGKISQACMNQIIKREAREQELAQFLQNLELQKKQHLAYLILSLEYDEEKAHQRIRDLEEENQQNQALRRHAQTPSTSSTHTSIEISIEETLYHYEKAKEALLQELIFTTTEVDTLEKELSSLEKHIALLFTKKQLQQSIHQLFEQLNDDDEIDQHYIQNQIDEVSHAYRQEMISLGKIETQAITPSFIKHWTLLDTYQLQAKTWDDFRSALKPGQKVVQKNGVLYLIEPGMRFETLSLEAREKAAHAYLTLKPKLEKTRLRIEEEDQLQQAELEQKKVTLVGKIDFEREKINFFQTRLQTLNHSIHLLTQLLNASKEKNESEQSESNLALQLKPRPNAAPRTRNTETTPRPTPQPKTDQIISNQSILKLDLCKIRCVNQTPPNQLSPQELSKLAAIERSKLIEELKARPKEIIPGAPPSPSLLTMLIALNKTTLNIDKRVNSTPEQRVEEEKNDPTASIHKLNPFKKNLDPFTGG
jgi:hypothetical protein